MIKVYIFDQDGTLYSNTSKLAKVLRERTKNWLMKRLDINKNEVEKMYKTLQHKYPNPFDGFTSLGLLIEEYHQCVFESVEPGDYIERDERLIGIFKKIDSPKFIVTLASKRYSNQLQHAIGIENVIDNTLFMVDFLPKHSKGIVYKSICRRLKIEPKNVCVIGDDFQVDIMPALKQSFHTILIGSNPEYNGITISTIYELSNTLKEGILFPD